MGIDVLGTPEDRFARRVMQRLRARGWPHSARLDREAFSIEAGDGIGGLYLGNIYRDWQACPKRERAKLLDRAINLLFEIRREPLFEEISAHLLPVVRNLSHLQATALAREAAPALELWQPYAVVAEPLGVVLAIDQPTSTALVQTALLSSWGLSFEAALERAMANLVARSPVSFVLTHGGFHVSDYGDGYDSSRLLMPELFTALQLPGEPVAVAVSRSCIVVAGSEQADALRAMAAFVVETLKAETRPTGYLPIVLRDGRWERFEPAAPDLAPIRELAVRQAVMDYDMQTPLLEAFFADRGEDVFVAPLEVGTQDNGEPQTWTTWAQGVPARLPRADWVGLAAKDERAMFRRWRDIEAVCGRFVEAPGFHPARFSPPAWPDGSGWRRLAREFDHPEWFYAGEPAG